VLPVGERHILDEAVITIESGIVDKNVYALIKEFTGGRHGRGYRRLIPHIAF
jgi:hypothetical protein